jgi:hypothetical protein
MTPQPTRSGVRPSGSDTDDETSADAKNGVGPEVRHHSLRKIPDIEISLSVDIDSGTTENIGV